MSKRRPTIEEMRQRLQEMVSAKGSNVVPLRHLIPASDLEQYEDDDDWDDDLAWDPTGFIGDSDESGERWSEVCRNTPLVIPSNFLSSQAEWDEPLQSFSKRQQVFPVTVPDRFSEIVRWLRTNDLQHAANISLRELQHWQNFSYHNCRHYDRLGDLLQRRQQNRTHLSMQNNQRFMSALYRYLSYWEQRNVHEKIRQKSWDEIDVPSEFDETLSALRALRESLLTFPSALTPFLHQVSHLLVPDERVGFGIRFELGDSHYYGESAITTMLHPIEGRYGIDCNCGYLNDEPCSHIRIMVEWLLDVLADPKEPAHQRLHEQLRTPSWQFGLRRLKGELDAIEQLRTSVLDTQSDERLAWRINLAHDDNRKELFEPIVQTRGKTGRWSKGRKISLSEVNTHHIKVLCQNNPLATEYFTLYQQFDEMPYPLFSQKLAHLLIRLQNEPRIFVQTDKSVPAKVVTQKVIFGIVPTKEGFRTTLRMGEIEIESDTISSRLISPYHLCHFDAADGIYTVGEVSEATYPFFRFCFQQRHDIPAEVLGELFSLLAQAETADVWVHPALRGRTVPSDSRIVARVAPEDDFEHRLSLHVYPNGSGTAYCPGSGPKELIREEDGTRLFVDRNLETERDAATGVANALQLPIGTTEPFNWHIREPEQALDVLSRLNELPDVAVEWPKDATPLRVLRAGTASLKVTARQKQNWFLIGGAVTVDDTDVSLKALLQAVRRKRRYVRLKKGEYLVFQKELYDRLSVLGGIGSSESDGEVSVPTSGIPFMDQQLQDLTFHGGKGWEAVKTRIAEAATLTPKVPKAFNGQLRPYQTEGFEWLVRLSRWSTGACLADDMGLGKTLQTLALILWRKRTAPTLIISPMSVCHNWVSEAAVFAPSLDVRLFHGVNRERTLQAPTGDTVLVTSYDTLTSSINQLEEMPFDMLVMDEAQMIKNALSKRAKAVGQIKADFRLALTGTPVENHLGDLWSIFHATIPGLLGRFDQFRRQYAIPIERDANPTARALLKQLVSPFLLRRTKTMVLPDLPPRIETISQVELDEQHMALYNNERQRILESLLSDDTPAVKKRFNALAGLTRLRRLACHPKLVDDTASLGSAKMDGILETIQDLVDQDQRALVFSQFTSHLALLQTALKRIGVGYLYLDGSTPQTKRKQLVARWHDGKAPLFIISLKAGGFGLNLTGADYVLHLDPWWNPAAEDQATDRTHRIGQTKPVTVVRFIACDTVEQGVVALHEQKRELAESILSDTAGSKQLTPDELIALIRGE